MSKDINNPPSFVGHLLYTPENQTPSGALVPQKRTAVQGIIIPCATRPCLSPAKMVSHGLQSEPFYSSEYTQGISAYDEMNRHKVQQVPNYVTDIYQRLYYAEVSCTNLTG